MVKIIDGEIVQDDDPRLQRRKGHAGNTVASSPSVQQIPSARAGGPVGQSAGRPVFDWSATPFKLVSAGNGQFPDAEIFGVAMPGLGLVAVAAAGLLFGWRGLLGGAVIGYLYMMNRPAAGASDQQTAGISAAGANLWRQMQQGSEPSNSSNLYQQASTQQRDAASSRNTNSWANLGKGHKLGSS